MYFCICQLTQVFRDGSNKLQSKIDQIQFKRPRGNPANQFPHVPMTDRIRQFYQKKAAKETALRKDKDLLTQTYNHERAILTSPRTKLENQQMDIESEIRIIKIKLHQ